MLIGNWQPFQIVSNIEIPINKQFYIIPKLSDLSVAKKRFTQVNPDLEIVAIHPFDDFDSLLSGKFLCHKNTKSLNFTKFIKTALYI
jgi:hypothetical protein